MIGRGLLSQAGDNIVAISQETVFVSCPGGKVDWTLEGTATKG